MPSRKTSLRSNASRGAKAPRVDGDPVNPPDNEASKRAHSESESEENSPVDLPDTVIAKIAEKVASLIQPPTDISSVLDAAVEKFNSKIESVSAGFMTTVQSLIADVRLDMDAKLKNSVSGLEEKINAKLQAERAEAENKLRAEVDRLCNAGRTVESRMEALDRESRSKNLVVFNLPVDDSKAIREQVQTLFPTVSPNEVLEARRFRRANPGNSGKPPAVIVRFASHDAKHSALKEGSRLRSNKVYMDLDLTPYQLGVKRGLSTKYAELKMQGERPFWRAERLFCHRNGRVQEIVGESSTARAPPGAPGPSAMG